LNILTRFLIVFSLLWSGSTAFANQSETDGDWEEEVYLSFRYLGVIDEILVAVAKDGEFYYPLTELFELFAINYTQCQEFQCKWLLSR